MAKFTKRERVCVLAIVILTALFLAFLTLFPKFSDRLEPDLYTLCELAISRLLGGMIFLFLIPYLGYPLLSFRRVPGVRSLLLTLPALVIALNNFPILGLLNRTVWITEGGAKAAWLVLACIGIGFFEEVAFRGVLFPALLPRCLAFVRKKKKPNGRIASETVAVFLSILAVSAVFGLVHALNLFAGGDPIGVLMQVGYSFLIGGMCSIVLLKTRCIWFPVAIHAIYDLGGMLIRYLGGGKLWDTPTVILTAFVSVVVALYFIVLLFRMKPAEIEGLIAPMTGGHDG